eukprot:6195465-Pleurochrysis_carterae.AAC.1
MTARTCTSLCSMISEATHLVLTGSQCLMHVPRPTVSVHQMATTRDTAKRHNFTVISGSCTSTT